MTDTDCNRRQFLQSGTTTLGALGGMSLAPALFVHTAEERPEAPIRLVLMGLHSRGLQLLHSLMKFSPSEVEIVTLADPDSEVFAPALKVLADHKRPVPETVADFRRGLDDPKVDAIVCAAPDHWHALATIWGCQAGKHVYVEKPVCHNPAEGWAMVAAARKYDRKVQAGTQRRSAAEIREAIEMIHAGKIGKVHLVKCWTTGERPSIGKEEVISPPANLDFNLWCGPAQDQGYKKNLVHYHWHWRWNYGTGECGNNGIHSIDVARWGLQVDGPEFVSGGGDRYFFEDDQETPDTQFAVFDTPKGAIHFEHRTWTDRMNDGQGFGIAFLGSEGTLVIGSSGWTIYGGKKREEVLESRKGGDYMQPHFQNFFDAIRKDTELNAEIEKSVLSTQFCHLANIALRTRSTLKYDPKTHEILDNPAAIALTRRENRPGFEIPQILP